jgi:hypothetical protein
MAGLSYTLPSRAATSRSRRRRAGRAGSGRLGLAGSRAERDVKNQARCGAIKPRRNLCVDAKWLRRRWKFDTELT